MEKVHHYLSQDSENVAKTRNLCIEFASKFRKLSWYIRRVQHSSAFHKKILAIVLICFSWFANFQRVFSFLCESSVVKKFWKLVSSVAFEDLEHTHRSQILLILGSLPVDKIQNLHFRNCRLERTRLKNVLFPIANRMKELFMVLFVILMVLY